MTKTTATGESILAESDATELQPPNTAVASVNALDSTPMKRGLIGGGLGYQLLRWMSSPEKRLVPPTDQVRQAVTADTLRTHFAADLDQQVAGKVVIDFGCGNGQEAVQLAKMGARKVIGVDIREEQLEMARQRARQHGVDDICQFCQDPDEPADLIISKDAFEHFARPDLILQRMAELIRSQGSALIAFGPTWFHPFGGHLFSVFPWAHLVFSEEALIRWRSDFKSDGATRFHEVSGGLNQITVKQFEKYVGDSPFEVEEVFPVPIRPLRWFHCNLTREATTSIVRCRLRKP